MEVREPAARYLKPFQRTELGEFPSDWKVVPLRTFEPFITSGSRGWAAFYADLGSIFLRITNLSRSCIYPSLQDLRYVAVPPENSEGVRTALMADDVLISITADIGIVGLVTEAVDLPAYINQHIALVRFAEDTVNSRYIAYFLAGASAQRRFKSMTDAGAKAGMNLGGVGGLLVAIPPTTDEQVAIAQALSDVDALIAGLEKLIAKKRDLKQAAMQQLLTGQTRLPGFSGEWVAKRLGDLANVLKGRGLSKGHLVSSGTNSCILYGELFTTYERVINSVISKTNSPEGFLGLSGDVLLPGSTTTKGIDLAVASALQVNNIQLGGDINVIRMKHASSYDPVFMAYLLTHTQKLAIADLAQGSTIIHLYGRSLLNLMLKLPVISEQTAIATALSSMDAEIAALEIRLTKTRELKQGMMQELLTGRTRLV